MKRINISYDGGHYTIGNRELSAVQAEIEAAIVSGKPHWLRVNHGEGSFQDADLLITPSTHIVLMGIEEPSED
ncbi:hypothetical protein [Glaciihabitans sp. dw_435]|uniref:hypothetical protein n=1 Tax=Glaciihabitans sp. dw_435 TaxID=2720081 RepID=UPI001BD227D5|nr:hypothetical protein [Glaciihabitans sp. dw_435]